MATMENMNSIFIQNPSSFRMNKNSSTAAMIKASITDKLNQLFVSYNADDVLAEYIVVLVCNGKDQNQAKDHLEAFLGDQTAEFVSWLWDLLLTSAGVSHMLGVEGDDNTLTNDEHECIPSNFASQPVCLDNKGSQHCEIEMDQLTQSPQFPIISRPTEYSSKVKVSSGVLANSEKSMIPMNENKIISICRKILRHERFPLPKYGRCCNFHERIQLPNYGRRFSHLRLTTKGTGAIRYQLSPKPFGYMTHRNNTRRVSVWDRLGGSRGVIRTTDVHNIDAVTRKIVQELRKVHYRKRPRHFSSGAKFNRSLKSEITASDLYPDTVISNPRNDDDKILEYDLSPSDKKNRKRQFCEIGSAEESKCRHLHHTKPPKQFKRSSSGTSTKILHNISSGNRETELVQTCPDTSPDNDDDDKRLEYDLNPVDKTKRKRKSSKRERKSSKRESKSSKRERKSSKRKRKSSHFGSKEESKRRHFHYTEPLKRSSSAKHSSKESLNSISSGTRQLEMQQTCPNVFLRELNGEALDSAKTNVNPLQLQLFDTKLRLRQIEKQMPKLKPKQLESNEGELSESDEDIESRTIIVTKSLSIRHKRMSISNPPRNSTSGSPSVDVTGHMGSLRTGLKNATGERGGYRKNVMGWNMELGSPGIYNNNPSLMYHTFYGYNPQMPYGPYYQQLVPSNTPHIDCSAQTNQTVPVGFYQQSDGMLFCPRPGYPPQFGSFGRGNNYQNDSGNASFYDSGQGFDGVGFGAHWSDSFKSSDQERLQASQQQRPSYGLGIGSSPHNRRYPHSGGANVLSKNIRGPRASKPMNQATYELDSSVVLDKNGATIAEANSQSYNRPDFVAEYCDAKFFVIKSYSEDDIHKSIKYGVWASTPSGNRKLDAAYHEAIVKQCPVFLLFSVNASGQFCGVAEMVGPVDSDKSVDYWQQDNWSGQFPVKWQMVKDVPNSQFRHIIIKNNDHKPVTRSRDTQEVELEQGIEILNIVKYYDTNMSILNDFDYYEERQRAKQESKARQQATLMAFLVIGGNEVVQQRSKSLSQGVRSDGNIIVISTEGTETHVDKSGGSASKVQDSKAVRSDDNIVVISTESPETHVDTSVASVSKVEDSKAIVISTERPETQVEPLSPAYVK